MHEPRLGNLYRRGRFPLQAPRRGPHHGTGRRGSFYASAGRGKGDDLRTSCRLCIGRILGFPSPLPYHKRNPTTLFSNSLKYLLKNVRVFVYSVNVPTSPNQTLPLVQPGGMLFRREGPRRRESAHLTGQWGGVRRVHIRAMRLNSQRNCILYCKTPISRDRM